jgi:two-component system sensor histidine kinase BaeS
MRHLWSKVFLVLMLVTAISLSSALILRETMMGDFESLREGEMLDRVYHETVLLEEVYAQRGSWDAEALRLPLVFALLSGLETRLIDEGGALVTDTGRALEGLPPSTREKVEALFSAEESAPSGEFVSYPLFHEGRLSGYAEVRFLLPGKILLFRERTNRFLALSFLAAGFVALGASFFFSRALTAPLSRLVAAVEAVGSGDLRQRVEAGGRDEIGRLSASFNRTAEILENQEKLRSRLLADVAHGLRTPVAVLKGEIEAMMDGHLPADRRGLLSLLEETDRMGGIIGGIESLARAEGGALNLRKETLDAGDFLRGTLRRFDTLFREKDVALSLHAEEGLLVEADPRMLEVVFENLLRNALAASDRGGETSVRAFRQGDEVLFVVEDRGKGIGKEDLPFIFDRFYRKTPGGLGIGLTIVRELVRAHGGSVGAESEEGRGARFTVRLPGLHNVS